MDKAEYVSMSSEDREFLQRRGETEASMGRLIIGTHIFLLAIMLAIAFLFDEHRARAPLFIAAILGVSGAGWFVYIRLLARWIAQDLASCRACVARVHLVEKRLRQRKANWVHCLYLDPPLPKKKIIVSARVYDGIEDGDWLNIRYFPVSKIIMRVEKV